jgi:hypothetical protein
MKASFTRPQGMKAGAIFKITITITITMATITKNKVWK